jgi:hypothetical protein
LTDLFEGFHPLGFSPQLLVQCHQELGKAIRSGAEVVGAALQRWTPGPG